MNGPQGTLHRVPCVFFVNFLLQIPTGKILSRYLSGETLLMFNISAIKSYT